MLAKLYLACMFSMYLASFIYNMIYIRKVDPKTSTLSTVFNYKGYGGKFKYMTFINFILQTFYYGLCVVNALFGTNGGPEVSPKKKSSLQKLRDYIHSTLAFPVGSFVVLTFWSIYAIDRELVFPRELDKIIPVWLNHVMHTFILPILLVDKYLNYHHLPKRKNGILGLLVFGLAYLVWLLWIAYYAGIWVYPILRVLEPYQRAIFFAFLLMLFISLYLLGESLTRFLWRKEIGAALYAPRSNKSYKSSKSKKNH